MSKFAVNETEVTTPEPSWPGQSEILFNYSISGHYPDISTTRLQLSQGPAKDLLVKATRIRKQYNGTGMEQSVACIATPKTRTALLAMFEAAFQAPLAEPAKMGRDGSWCYVTRYGTDPMEVFSWCPSGQTGDGLFVASVSDIVGELMQRNPDIYQRTSRSFDLEDDAILRMSIAAQTLAGAN